MSSDTASVLATGESAVAGLPGEPPLQAESAGNHFTYPAAERAGMRAGNGHARSARSASAPALPWDFAEKELLRVATAWSAVKDAFFHLALLLLFCFYFLADAGVSDRFTLRDAVYARLVRGRSSAAIANFKTAVFFHDIANAEQYSSFVMHSLLPNLVDITYPTGSNLLVGALRFRTQRVVNNRCRLNAAVVHKPDSTSTSATALFAISSMDQSCFGDLGGGGGSLRAGGTSKPRKNELTGARGSPTHLMNASFGDQLKSTPGALWVLLGSTVMTDTEAASSDTDSAEADDEGRIEEIYANGTTLWRYSTCAELNRRPPRGGKRTRMSSGINGMLGHYHCGGFYFDVPFWIPSNATCNGVARPYDSSGTDLSSSSVCYDPREDEEDEATMNDPDLVSIPYYTLYYQRRDLQSAMALTGARLVSSGSKFFDDTATRLAVTEFYLYHPALHIFLSVKLYAEVVSGGAWLPRTELQTFSVWTRENRGKAAYDLAFFSIAVLLAVRKLTLTVRRCRRQEPRTLLSALLVLTNVWNLLDVATFCLLAVSGAFRIAFLVRCAQLHIQLPELVYGNTFPTPLDSVVLFANVQRYINSTVTVLLFARTLRYLAYFFTPVAFLARILFLARQKLLGVQCLFLLIILSYAVTGHVLLSSTALEFRSVDSSFRFFFYLLLRQVNVEGVLQRSSRPIEVIFLFWSFLLIVGVAVLNGCVGVLIAAARSAEAEMTWVDADVPSDRRFHTVMPPTVQWMLQRYFVANAAHPSRWRDLCARYFHGCDYESLLLDAVRNLKSFRCLRYPVRRSARDGDTDTLTESVFLHGLLLHGRHDGLPESSNTQASPSSPSSAPACSVRPAAAPPLDAFAVFFYEDLWSHVEAQWLATRRTAEAVQTRERVRWATAAVESVAGAHMDALQRMPERLRALEVNTTLVANMLAEFPVSTA